MQTIAHPSNSLWSAAVVPAANGTTYIASASQDSAIRFFTRDPTLVAPPTERERWDKDVSQRQLDKWVELRGEVDRQESGWRCEAFGSAWYGGTRQGGKEGWAGHHDQE